MAAWAERAGFCPKNLLTTTTTTTTTKPFSPKQVGVG
jgi:hypothetical protein